MNNNEPFDELMGPPPIRRNNNSNGSNRGDNSSPHLSRSLLSTSLRGAPPPSAAFSHSNNNNNSNATVIPDRWAQYEQDSAVLQAESAAASARAVAAAAERAAFRDTRRKPLFEDQGDDVGQQQDDHAWTTGRQRKPYRDDPDDMDDDDMIQRTLEQEFLDRQDRHPRSASPSGRVRSSSFEDVTFEEEDDDDDFARRDVRAEALKVLELAEFAEGRIASSRQTTTTSAAPAFTFKSKRTPAALAGVDWSSAPRRASSSTVRSTHSNHNNVQDLLDVDRIETRAASSRPAMEDYLDEHDENTNTTTTTAPAKTWSSRYSVDHTLLTLSGGTFSAGKILDDMDKEQERIVKSARNMFSTSPHELKSSHSHNASPARGLRGFSFKQHPKPPPPIDFNLQSHRTVWTDVDINGHSLPPVPSRLSWQEQLERKKRQRRQCLRITLLVVILIIVMSVLLGIRNRWENSASSASSSNSQANDEPLTFYVTSNAPYKSEADTLAFRDELATLPADAAPFVVHLGNIQNSAVTLCPPVTYLAAKSLLLISPIPMLLLPGEHDWNDCPFPATSWQTWQHFFTQFEDNFSHNFSVQRPADRLENFAMVQNNVLILGLHLVGGRVDDTAEWHRRHVDDVQFVQDQVSQNGNVRAVVLLGNARPCPQTSEFFTTVKSTLQSLQKPVVYIHANSGIGNVEQYSPFSDVSNVMAVQAPLGGENPLLRVSVGFGSSPFTFS